MKKNIRIAILGILFILSIAMVIRWVSGEHMIPWQTHTTVINPLMTGHNSTGTYILDNGYHRVILVNQEGKAERIITCGGDNTFADAIYAVHTTQDYLYFAGNKLREGGIYSKKDQVLRFAPHKKNVDVIYSNSFGDSVCVARSQILCIWDQNDSLYFIREEDGLCLFYACPLLVSTNNDTNDVKVVRTLQMEEPITHIYHKDNGEIHLYGRYRHAWSWTPDGLQIIDPSLKHTETTLLYNHRQPIPLCASIILHNILFMLAVLYICILLGMCIVLLSRRIKTKHHDSASRTHHGRNILLLAVTAMLIAGFYTRYLYKEHQQGYTQHICSLREQLDYLIEEHYMDVFHGIAEQGLTYTDDSIRMGRLSQLNKTIRQMTQCPSHQQDVYADILMLDEQGQGINIADANEAYTFGHVMSSKEEMDHIQSNPVPGQPFEIWDEEGKYCTSIVPLKINDSTFFIETGYSVNDVTSASIIMVLKLFFQLLIIFLILYTIFSLMQKLPQHLQSFRESRAQQRSDAGVWLAGVLAFLFYAISAIDQGVMVYLVYSLSEGCTPAQLALRASLPMMLYMGIGMTAYLIHPVLRKWFGDRWCNMGAGILAVGVFALIAIGIYSGSFLIYCIGKGLSGMIMGIIFNSMYALPLIAKDHQLRNEGLAAITVSCLGANILFISLGGYISQYLGYEAVYIANALLSVVVILVAATVFPKGKATEIEETEEDPASAPAEGRLKRTLRFLLSGKMIAYYLGILLPFGMMNAYCYYLYPIYAETAGISVSELANMIVFGYALAFIFGEKLVRWKNQRNGLWVLVNVFVIMAILEITFAIAGNIYWATLVLMICCVMVAVPRSEANVFIAEESKKKGLDVRDTNSGFAFALDATEAAASPLMGWCISTGLIVGTNMIGCISLALTSIFALWQRHDEKKHTK